MPDEYYDTLGVGEDATDDEIRAAYRSKAQKLHPDKENGDVDQFKQLQHAYDVLSDHDKRSSYDKGEAVNNRLPTLDEKAASELARAFSTHLNGASDYVDLVLTVKSSLEVNLYSLDEEIKKGEQVMKQDIHLRERVTYNGEGSDLFHGLIDQRVESIRKSIEDLDQKRLALQRALELADDYKCEVLPPAKTEDFRSTAYTAYRSPGSLF